VILAGDIGGTNTRLALFADDLHDPAALAVFRSAELSGLEEAIGRFLAEHPVEIRGAALGGGIAPRLLAKLADGTFLRAFRAKGRIAPILDEIPVHVIQNDRAALIGAAPTTAASGGPK